MPVTVECLRCGKAFQKMPAAIRDGRGKYCSQPCRYAAISERYKGRKGLSRFGPDGPNWRGRRVERPCPVCGTTFAKPLPQQTCSRKCGDVVRRRKIVGQANPFARAHPAKTRICRCCGSEYRRQGGGAGTGTFYCSLECSQRDSRNSVVQARLIDDLRALGFEVVSEKSWPWLLSPHSNRRMRVDIFLPELGAAIEYDGRQHYSVAFAGNESFLQKIQERDREKDRLLAMHLVPLLRIRNWPKERKRLMEWIKRLRTRRCQGTSASRPPALS